MGFGSRAFLAGSLGFAAAFVVACGGSNGLLSADEASSLTSQLNSISSALGSHQCGEAGSAAAQLTNAVANLPPSVTTTLVKNLGQGAGTVSQLAQTDCTTTSSTSRSTSSTSSTPTTSSSSSTTSSTPSSTSTSSSTPTVGTSATNPTTPGTSTTSNGGAGVGATGTSTTGQGNGAGGVGGGNGQ
jgi:hypothetical protein